MQGLDSAREALGARDAEGSKLSGAAAAEAAVSQVRRTSKACGASRARSSEGSSTAVPYAVQTAPRLLVAMHASALPSADCTLPGPVHYPSTLITLIRGNPTPPLPYPSPLPPSNPIPTPYPTPSHTSPHAGTPTRTPHQPHAHPQIHAPLTHARTPTPPTPPHPR